uniref:Ig-like domain-containing protein n=1 Tax=Stenoxybacter acetivorans TaxID=422441 RepID=UPI00056854D9
LLGTAAVTTGNNWTFTDNNSVTDGRSYTYTAIVTTASGIESAPSNAFTINVDTTAPTQTVAIVNYGDDVGSKQGDFAFSVPTDDTNPTIKGSLSAALAAGEKVVVYRDGAEVGVATVTGSSWVFNDNANLADDTYRYTAQVRDAAGNLGPISTGVTLTVDTTAPNISNTTFTVDSVAGDNVINASEMTDPRGVEVKGSITNAPTETGLTTVVTVTVNSQDYIATVNGTNWSVWVPSAVLSADGDKKVEAKVTFTDLAGNTSELSGDKGYSIQTGLPSITISEPISGDGYINAAEAGAVVISGVTTDIPDGQTVTVDVTDGTAHIPGTAVVSNGAWSVSINLSVLNNGNLTITASVADPVGNAAQDTASAIIDTTPPTAIATITGITEDSGIVGDWITDDDTLILRGSINGTINAGEKVQLSFDGGATWLDAAATGQTWTLDHTNTPLPDGVTTVQARVIDAAGNTGTSTSQAITIISGKPDVTVDITGLTPDTGVQGDWITSATNITLSGTLSRALAAGERVYVSRDNGPFADITQFVNGTNWNYADSATLVSGRHDYRVWVENAAAVKGNIAEQSVMIDTVAPTATLAITGITEDTGVLGDFKTQDNTLVFNGTMGNLDAGDKVQISLDSGITWLDAVMNTAAGTWLYDNTANTMADGTYMIRARLIDAAANIGTQVATSVVISSAPPAGVNTTFFVVVDTADGLPPQLGDITTSTAVNNDLITRDPSPTIINGVLGRALAAGEILQLSTDNGVTWRDLTVINGTDWQALLDGNTYTTDASITVKMRLVGAVGSVFDMADHTIIVDLTAPAGLNKAPDIPQLVTTINTFSFSSAVYGKAEAGSRVALIDDVNGNTMLEEGLDKVVAWAQVDAGGNWSINNVRLAAGSHSLGFWVFDKAGNISSSSPFRTTGAGDESGSQPIVTHWGGTTPATGLGLNAAAATIDVNGNWNFFQSVGQVSGSLGTGGRANAGRIYTITNPLDDDYTSVYLTQPANLNNDGYQHYVNSAMFVDLNRDGFVDVMSQISDYGNNGRTAYWMNNGNGTWTPQTVTQGTLNHLGGAVAYDREGDGYLDFVLADSESDSISFMKNTNGALTYESNVVNGTGTSAENGRPPLGAYTIQNGLGTSSVTGATPPAALSVMHEIGTVDLDNNGTIDIIAHTDLNVAGTGITGNASRSMGIFYNTSERTQGFTYVHKANVFDNDGGDDSGKLSQSVTVGDYNNDGWLDVYINRGSKNAASSAESRIYLNDGTGKLNATDAQALWFGDSISGGTSFAVDWNFDGLIDIIEVPRQVTNNFQGVAGTEANKAPMLYLNNGTGAWGYNSSSSNQPIALSGINNNITGAVVVDYDWDGSLDLILYQSAALNLVNTMDNAAPSIAIRNANIAADGTALHVRIVDGFGINTFYGNTVKLYDSHGVCVSTQLVNPQSSGSSNSMGLVSFYGLDANETYSVQMLNAVNGSPANVGSVAGVQGSANAGGGYTNQLVNTNWGNLKAVHSNEAYVLTAEAILAENNAGTNSGNINNPFATGISGTGYNDTFFGTLGNDYYNGGGGWEVNAFGEKVWSETGGMDVLDYSRMTGWNIIVDMELGVATKVKGTDQYSDFFVNVEQVIGSGGNDEMVGGKGDDTLDGGLGNDTYFLSRDGVSPGGSDTIKFEVRDPAAADGTAGNGQDSVLYFHVGKVGVDTDADVIDLHALLEDYTGSPGLYTDEDGNLHLNVSSNSVLDFVDVHYDVNAVYSVTNPDGSSASVNGGTVISVDMDGNGQYSTLVTLYGVQTDLETLLANNQLVV